jgi:hypothetical protein
MGTFHDNRSFEVTDGKLAMRMETRLKRLSNRHRGGLQYWLR